jgi:integrase
MEETEKNEERISLNDTLKQKMIQYINIDSGYSYKTKKVYLGYVKNLFDAYSYLNKSRLRKIYNEKNPNKRAIYSLIYKVNDEYDLKLPIIRINPSRRIAREPPTQVYTLEQVKEIINLLPTEEAKLFFKIIYNVGAGLRVSEVINMRWNNLDWINWLGDKEGHGTFRFKTKRERSGSPPVPSFIMKELFEKAKKERAINAKATIGNRYFYYPDSEEFVFNFVSKNLENISPEEIKTDEELSYKHTRIVYDQIRNKWIIPHINKYLGYNFKIHSLRHSRSIQLLREGVPLAVISRLLGHKRLETTMVYLDMDSSQEAAFLNKVRNL